MLISHFKKFITIDIPKTGTRSLRETLVPLNYIDIIGQPNINEHYYQHDSALKCKDSLEKLGKNFDDYYSLVIVRNPWERYYSFYKYYSDYLSKFESKDRSIDWTNNNVQMQLKTIQELFNGDINKRMRWIVRGNPAQSFYYTDNNLDSGYIMVSQIGKFEDINKEFELFCEKISCGKIKLLHSNKSNISEKTYKDVFSQEIVDLIAEKEKLTIKLKNYSY